jgi:outer membrane protein assembly factor BamB
MSHTIVSSMLTGASKGSPERLDRRGFFQQLGQLAALGTVGLLTACQGEPAPIVVTPRPRPASDISRPASAPVGRPMYQMDPQHTGRSPHAGPRQAVVLRTFDTANPGFETPDPGDPRPEIQSSAAIGPDGTIYIGSFPGHLFALRDPGGGDRLELIWRFHPPGASSFHATPALSADGTVYIGFSTGGVTPEARGTFYALKAPASGIDAQVLWSVDLGLGRQTSSPTLGPDGTIYVVSGAGKLFALAPDGTVNWTVQTGPALKAAPAVGADGTVYVASMDGNLYAIAVPPGAGAKEGWVRWSFAFDEHRGSTPLVTAAVPPPGADAIGSGASPTLGPDGTIYVGANNSNFYAVTPDGKLKWLYEAEREVAGIWSSAALSPDGGTLYFGANKGGIYALNAADGSPRWQFKIYGSVYTSPTLDSKGTLYTGSTIGRVFALDSATGELILDYDAGAPVWTAPALRPDGSLVVADTNGRVMLLGAE